MKSVLLSIQPKWCELIASGEKTVEIRKSRPKIETPFKCYIYETKGETDTPFMDEDGHIDFHGRGQVIGEFICDEIKWHSIRDDFTRTLYGTCLTEKEILNYMNFPPVNPYQDLKEARKKYGYYGFYAYHISDLVIYDEPKSLGNFHHCGVNYHFNPPVMKPPQRWCYVEELEG